MEIGHKQTGNMKMRVVKMTDCPKGGKCREMLGCRLGIGCAKEVDEKMDEWAKDHGWD